MASGDLRIYDQETSRSQQETTGEARRQDNFKREMFPRLKTLLDHLGGRNVRLHNTQPSPTPSVHLESVSNPPPWSLSPECICQDSSHSFGQLKVPHIRWKRQIFSNNV